jgi:serine/threonine protein kinase
MVFASYSIQRVLGAGKRDGVYLATDRRLLGPVALKLVYPKLTAARLTQRADVASLLAYKRDPASVPAAVTDASACHVAHTRGL